MHATGQVTAGEAVAERLAALATFLEAQAFCLLGTASGSGACDCSYRGRQAAPYGAPEPLLAVLPGARLHMPDYQGNHFFNSLGNLAQRAAASLLFVDFDRGCTIMLQGQARVIDVGDVHRQRWPTALRVLSWQVQRIREQAVASLPALELA